MIGGLTFRNAELMIQSQTGIKMEKEKYERSPNLAFITSLVYTVISFAVILYEYRSYF